MRITIDTSVDKEEDIRKAIEFLKGYLDKAPEPVSGETMMGMFGNDEPVAEKKEEPERKEQEYEIDTITLQPY